MTDKLTDAVESRRDLANRIDEINAQIEATHTRLVSLKTSKAALLLAYQGLAPTIKAEAAKL